MAFRASSRKTRIETWIQKTSQKDKRSLSERHPEKQGLKPCETLVLNLSHVFQSVIQKNKDWNILHARGSRTENNFQSVIQKNKDWNLWWSGGRLSGQELSERHPEKQGLKLSCAGSRLIESGPSFRASSRKTRIETMMMRCPMSSRICFQSVIQKNKDWNVPKYIFPFSPMPFRASSRKTRIETRAGPDISRGISRLSERHPEKQGLKPGGSQGIGTHQDFQSVIQKNKDWNLPWLSWLTCQ